LPLFGFNFFTLCAPPRVCKIQELRPLKLRQRSLSSPRFPLLDRPICPKAVVGKDGIGEPKNHPPFDKEPRISPSSPWGNVLCFA